MGSVQKFQAYRNRDIVLKKLGFESYGHYLKSELWSGIRKRVLERDRFHCRVCRNRAATTAHHKRYHHCEMTGYTIKRIIAVCSRCHYRLEFREKKKVEMEQANQKYNGIMYERFQYARDSQNHLPQPSEFDALCQDGLWPFLRQT